MRKSFVLCLAIVMCLFAVTGSIAYFTDSVQATGNVVKAGNLDIEQFEYGRLKDDNGNYNGLIDVYKQNQAIYPCVMPENPNRTEVDVKGHKVMLYDASLRGFIDKIVVVKNNGTLPVYLRTFVAVPDSFKEAIVLDWNTADGWSAESAPIQATITDTKNGIENVLYNIYYVTNANSVAAGASAPPSLLGFYLTSNYKNENNDDTLNILVATQASQVIPTGIGNDDQHMKAEEALAATYDEVSEAGEVITIRHPWLSEKSTQ